MAEKVPPFQQIQFAFAAYLRDPERNPPPRGPAPERMKVYRELFFNNIENFLASGFPVIKSILNRNDWLALVQGFYATHRSNTPYFAEIGEQFLDYLQNEREPSSGDPPFLLELAHYEWVELALVIAEGEVPAPSADLIDDPLGQTIHLSEVAWPLAYRFPVHRIGPNQQPSEPPEQATCLVVYRDMSDTVKFLEISPVTYRLLQILEDESSVAAADCLKRLATEIGYSFQALAKHGAETLRALAERGVIGAS
jgi:hypothetical protein